MLKILLFVVIVGTAFSDKHEHHKDHHHEHHHPQPYHFGYHIKDKHGAQYRKEEGDGHGSVKGSYGYTDEHGIHREVHYIADHDGFRAEIKTNEPGTANQDPANVKMHSHVTHHHQQHYDHHQEKHHDDQQHKHDRQLHHKSYHHAHNYHQG